MSNQPPTAATAYIALGSNLGDRQDFLDRALTKLRATPGITVAAVSSSHETAPVGGPPGQNPYLNAAAKLQTTLTPRQLLDTLLDIERALGRMRVEHHGPRTIDLDLLLYEERVIQEPGVTVPHPRMHERLFVLEPLAEIAADVIHPHLGKSVTEMLLELKQSAEDLEFKPPEIEQLRREVGKGYRELTGMRALVTGSSSGIGLAIAHDLAAGGADVIVHGRRPKILKAIAEQIPKWGVRAHALAADLSQPEECDRLVRSAWAEWNGLDLWVNNAGVDTLTGEAAHWPFERKLDELWKVDVRATMHLARAIGDKMKQAGGGCIVNMGWDQAETGMEGDSGQIFAAVKGAVMAFSKSLALTLAPTVRVNCIAPGWIKTAWGDGASKPWQDRVIRETPLGRWGKPEEVAAVVRWLASPAASFITGQTLRINGGAVR